MRIGPWPRPKCKDARNGPKNTTETKPGAWKLPTLHVRVRDAPYTEKHLGMALMRTPGGPSPHGQADRAEDPCECCQGVRGSPARLVHDASGATMTACLRCVRSVMQMQVEESDQRGRSLLFGSAEELGWQVWRADKTLYLVPSVAPFVPQPI